MLNKIKWWLVKTLVGKSTFCINAVINHPNGKGAIEPLNPDSIGSIAHNCYIYGAD